MTNQRSNRIDKVTTTHLRIEVTATIVQHWHSNPGPDDTAPADDIRAEPRTRQQHAATDAAGTSAGTE